MQYNDLFIFVMLVMFLIGMCVATMKYNEPISKIDTPEQILTVEQQKEICDSIYSDYMFHFTAYQNAIYYGESESLIKKLQQQYVADSLQLRNEMKIYFQLKQNEAK